MAVPKIEGKWTGYFVHGKSYPKKIIGLRVAFTIDLINENGLIKGTCLDDYSKHFNYKPATIEGTAEKYAITFVKTYPGLLTVDENNQVIGIPNEPSPGILYIGTLQKKMFRNRYIIKGRWDISGSFLDENGNANYYTLDGTWLMKPTK